MANEFVQTMADARADAQSLSDFVFKPSGFKVARRLAPTIDTLQFYINRFDALDGDFSSSVSVALSSLSSSVAEADGKVAYIETTVQDAINNTAVEGGVLADTFVTVTPNGAGQIARNQRDKNNDTVTVLDYGADNTGSKDSTLAIQAAINTGRNVDLVGGVYLVTGLTQSTTAQAIYASTGDVVIKSNTDGDIISSTGNDVKFINIRLRGGDSSSYITGNGFVAIGSRVQFLNCGASWVGGRCIKATGSRTVIKGTNNLYHTADTSNSGYEIEIGKSGVSTLYHELDEVYTGKATGGILLIDTGSHTIKGGQFGKLSIMAGTRPAGVNGGKTIGARILGNVLTEVSNTQFIGNTFSSVTVTFSSDTSGCSLDSSNIFASGGSVVNMSGKGNFYEMRDGNFGIQTNNDIIVEYGNALRFKDVETGSLYKGITNTSGKFFLGDISLNTTIVGQRFELNTASGTQLVSYGTIISPNSNNTTTLGISGKAWKGVCSSIGFGAFNKEPPATKPVVSGDLKDGSALKSLLTALAQYGFVDDGTS